MVNYESIYIEFTYKSIKMRIKLMVFLVVLRIQISKVISIKIDRNKIRN